MIKLFDEGLRNMYYSDRVQAFTKIKILPDQHNPTINPRIKLDTKHDKRESHKIKTSSEWSSFSSNLVDSYQTLSN